MNNLLEGLLGFILADPWMLLLAAAIPVVWWWRAIRGNPAIGVGDAGHFAALPATWRVRARGIPAALETLAILLAILALARPVVRERVPTRTEGLDILLAIDISSSMTSKDMDDAGIRSRLEAVKAAAKQFIDARENDRIAILTFALFPELRSPLTLDHRASQKILADIEPVIRGSQEDRTAIGLGLARAARILKDSQARERVVVLLTDGQENVLEITPADAAKLAKDFGVKVYTIGAGRGERTIVGWQAIDFSELEKVAEATGGKAFRAEDKDSLQATYAEIDRLEKKELEDPRYTQAEKFTWFLAPALVALTLACFLRSSLFAEVP